MPKGFSQDLPESGRPDADTLSTNGQSDGASSGKAILLVDDNREVARAMAIAFTMAGYRFDDAASPEEAFSRLATSRYDAILLDMNFTAGQTSGDEGLACLARMLEIDPRACIVVITAHSGIRIAVAAMQAGACDFVMKPWRNAELIAKVEAAMARGARPNNPMPTSLSSGSAAGLLGDSAAVARVRDLIRRIGPTAAGVTITGPSGSGRGLVARLVHAASPHADRPLPSIDLRDPAAWQGLDHATGSVLLRHPDRLDDITQTRLVERLPAGARPIAIADSTASLTPALRGRIATIDIPVPPLRDRENDALILARHLVRVMAERHARPLPRLTPAAEALVHDQEWPDEVRGLALAIERAVLLSSDDVIDAAALAPPVAAVASAAQPSAFDLADTERAVIAAALREHHHNVSHAAAALGLSRGALYRRMARHGL